MEASDIVSLDQMVLMFKPFNVSVEYNPHKTMHQSMPEYFEHGISHFIDYEECVRTGVVYVLRVYPRNSVGFYEIAGRFYDDVMRKMYELLASEVT